MKNSLLPFFLCLFLANFSIAQDRNQNSEEKRLEIAEEHNMYDVPGAKIVDFKSNAKFQFDYQITFEMKGNGLSSRQKIWIGKDSYWATSDPNIEDVMIVFDVENKNMILCDKNMKTAQIVNKDAMVSAPNVDVFLEKNIDSNSNGFKKTRKKNKTIAGYKCEAFEMDVDGDLVTVWINKKIKINNQNILASILPMTGASNQNIPVGLIMEIETTGVSKLSSMKVLKVDKKQTSIDLGEFAVEELINAK